MTFPSGSVRIRRINHRANYELVRPGELPAVYYNVDEGYVLDPAIVNDPSYDVFSYTYNIADKKQKVDSFPTWFQIGGVECVWAYQPKGAASYAYSKVNIANPGTYDAVEGSAPVWDASRGWIFSGTSYLWTQFVLPPTYQTEWWNWTLMVQFANGMTTGHSQIIEAYSMYLQNTDNSLFHYVEGYDWSFTYEAPPIAAGNLAVTPENGYRDGVAFGTWTDRRASQINSVVPSQLRIGGAPAFRWTGDLIAVALWRGTMSAANVAVAAARMAAL